MRFVYDLAESGRLPDPLIRFGIRRQLGRRLRSLDAGDRGLAAVLDEMRSAPVALHPADANEQHYELPAEFFRLVLGRRLKYSCGYWPPGVDSLDGAEEAALEQVGERAGLADGMEILELGCGWGSLSLWMAERYPASRILAVSNSGGQRRFIEAARDERGLGNLGVVTADMNDFAPPASGSGRRFDRVVSIEMFEHMRNYRELLARIASWLDPGGRLFVHVFCHRRQPYFFEDRGRPGDWMARHFFTGGLMPSEDIFRHFEDHLVTEERWRVGGRHYERTARAWLAEMDARPREARRILAGVYGESDVERWFHRWRIFFLSCAELFGYRQGREWYVAHSLLRPV